MSDLHGSHNIDIVVKHSEIRRSFSSEYGAAHYGNRVGTCFREADFVGQRFKYPGERSSKNRNVH
jgi:hypothetical protein